MGILTRGSLAVFGNGKCTFPMRRARVERKQKRSLDLSVYAGRDGELESRLRTHAAATSAVIEVNLPTCTNQLSRISLYSASRNAAT
jgi:hypothetical protein